MTTRCFVKALAALIPKTLINLTGLAIEWRVGNGNIRRFSVRTHAYACIPRPGANATYSGILDTKNCETPLVLRETRKTKAGKRADVIVARIRDRARDVRVLPMRCTVGHRANSK